MTTRINTQRQQWLARIAALCAVALGSAACSATDSDSDYADVYIAPQSIEPPTTHETTGRAGELQYGDSIDDLFFGSTSSDDSSGSTGSDGSGGSGGSDGSYGSAESAQVTLRGFRQLAWDDLIPPGFSSEEVFARYEERLAAAERESPELRALYDEMDAEFDNAGADQALDGEQIELAGFVAPLTYDSDTITEFLLVPYFGACIHVPPPPTNQTVLVTLAEGESLTIEESWGAVRVAGEMQVSTTDTGLATASYSVIDAEYDVYDT